MISSVIGGLGYSCEVLEKTQSDKDEGILEVIITSETFDIKTMDEIVKIHKHFQTPLFKDEENLEMEYKLGVEDEVIKMKIDVFIPHTPWGIFLYEYKVSKSILYDRYKSVTLGPNIIFYNNGYGFIDAKSFMLGIKTNSKCKLSNESEFENKIVLYQPNSNKLYKFSYKGAFDVQWAQWVNSNGATEEVSYL